MRADNENRPWMPVPRGFSREQAATYVGISTGLFDTLVGDGRMPPPVRINTRSIWDRFELDAAFDALPRKTQSNPWDDQPDVIPLQDARRQRRGRA